MAKQDHKVGPGLFRGQPLYWMGILLLALLAGALAQGMYSSRGARRRYLLAHLARDQRGVSVFRLSPAGPASYRGAGLEFPRGPYPGRDYQALVLAGFTLPGPVTLDLDLTSDDGARVLLDGKVVLSDWHAHPARSRRASVSLAAGPHSLALEHFQLGKGAVLNLELGPKAAPAPVLHPVAASFELETWRGLLVRERWLAWGLVLVLLVLGLWAAWPGLRRAGPWLWRLTAGDHLTPRPGAPYAPWKPGNRLAWLSFALLALVFTYPLLTDLAHSIPCDLWWSRQPQSERWSDQFQYLWSAWWLKQALLSGSNPFFCPLIYHPFGASLAYHTTAFAFALPTVPLQLLLGLVPAFNIVFLLTLTFTAYNTYYAVRGLVGDGLPAWLAGFIFAFNPAHLGRGTSNMCVFSTLWLPLFVYVLFRAGEEPRRRGLWLGLGLLAALNLYASIYNFMFCLVFMGFYLLVGPLVLGRPRWSRGLWTGVGLAVAITALAGAPLLGQMLELKFWGLGVVHLKPVPPVPPQLLFTRPLLHPWFSREISQALAPHMQFHWHYYLGLPLVVLALAALANRRHWRQVLFFLLAGVFFLLAGLDPNFVENHLLGVVPFLRDFRGFDQFLTMTYLCLAFLAALALGQVPAGRENRRLSPRLVCFGLLVLLLGFEFWSLPYPTYRVRVPPAFAQIARDPRSVAVLELPLETGRQWVGPSRNLLYQTVHGKARFASTLSRIPAHLYQPYQRYKNLTRLRQGARFNTQNLNRELDRLRVGYVVVERRYYPAWRRLEALAQGELGWEFMDRDREYTFYRRRLPPQGRQK